MMRSHPTPTTARRRPLGEPEPGYRAGSTAHVHVCPACEREYVHDDVLCPDGYERVAVGCWPVTPRLED